MIRATLLATSLALAAPPAGARCRQALALGLDVSGSVDSGEYALQRQGLVRALTHPEVTAALLTQPDEPVELMVFEWSGPGASRTLLPWTAIDSPAALDTAAARIATAPRSALPPSTALGFAMRHGIKALAPRPCRRRTLDISGDGTSNTGPRPGPIRAEAEAAGITVNALVIGPDTAGLEAYFRAYVTAGPGAFTETAAGFADYEAAMVRKLKRELQGLMLSRL